MSSAASSVSVAHVWERIVDRAIEQDVDVVALTGDVVDRENRYYEALGPLERGIERLVGRDICVVAVSGNHDFDVLPRLVDVVGDERFCLLGRGGRWEEKTIECGEQALRFVGWSYPTRHVQTSPLDDLELTDGAMPTVGLIHGELDRPASPYAPVTRAGLEATGIDAWLLGHIHRPQHFETAAGGAILYPGSPQPLGPTEQGVHGPWIVELFSQQATRCRQIPLATVRYEELAVDLNEVDTSEGFDHSVPEQIRRHLQQIAEDAGTLQRVVYRLRYQGRTALHRQLEQLSQALVADLELSFEATTAEVDRVYVDTTPHFDLRELATGQDPPAVLAGLLVELRDDEMSDEAKALFRSLRDVVRDVYQSNAYGPLRADKATADEPDDDWIRDQALREGLSLLDEMLARKRSKRAR